jgi:nucleoside-diphosphate-sugar epimerase
VRGLARREARPPLDAPVELVRGAVEDRASVERAAAGCDAIVHLASWVHRIPRGAADERSLRAMIVDGTRHAAEVARARKARLVVASTVAVYGSRPAVPSDESSPTHPETPYARAKLEAEEVARSIEPDAIILRVAAVYGPHDRGNMVSLIRMVERGLGVVVGGGSNRKSVVYVENLADRIVRAIERDDLGGVWIAADSPAPTQRELMSAIARALGRRPPLTIPQAPLRAAASLVDVVGIAAGRKTFWRSRVEKLAQSTVFSGAALDEKLGYRPPVDLAEGLRRAVAWSRARGEP